jgi:four helix bundle protein
MKENIILDKSYKFAIRIIRLYLHLKNKKNEFELSEQIVRSGTSIGANVEETVGGYSRKEFSSKLGIDIKKLGRQNIG